MQYRQGANTRKNLICAFIGIVASCRKSWQLLYKIVFLILNYNPNAMIMSWTHDRT